MLNNSEHGWIRVGSLRSVTVLPLQHNFKNSFAVNLIRLQCSATVNSLGTTTAAFLRIHTVHELPTLLPRVLLGHECLDVSTVNVNKEFGAAEANALEEFANDLEKMNVEHRAR